MSKSDISFKGKKILVGDYVETSAFYTTKTLNKLGIVVDVVKTGEEIVRIIQSGKKKYDAIFTNHLYRDGYDGVTTLYNLRKIKGFNTPVVIHTIDFDARHEYVDEIGFDEYIEKPVDIEKVIPVLQRIWNNQLITIYLYVNVKEENVMKELKAIRAKNHFTCEYMANHLNISKPFYWQIENEKRGLSYKMAVKIAKIFNLKPDDIFYKDFTNKE